LELVEGDERPQVVGAHRYQHRVDELERVANSRGLRLRIRGPHLRRPELRDPRRMGREKVAELRGHAAAKSRAPPVPPPPEDLRAGCGWSGDRCGWDSFRRNRCWGRVAAAPHPEERAED